MENLVEDDHRGPLRMVSAGMTIGGHCLPPFRLHAGEALCLHVEHAPYPWYDGLLPVLKGEVAHQGLRLHGSVGYLEKPMPRRGWFGRRKDCSARDWLVSKQGLSSAQAAEILARALVPPELKIGWMGCNERSLLALEACFVQPPDVLVFDTAGHDTAGIRNILDRMLTRPQSLAVIYLKTRVSATAPCLSGSICVDASVSPPASALVE